MVFSSSRSFARSPLPAAIEICDHRAFDIRPRRQHSAAQAPTCSTSPTASRVSTAHLSTRRDGSRSKEAAGLLLAAAFSARARPASGTRSSCLTLAPQPLRTRRYASRQPGATFLKDPTEPMNRALERACERHGLKIIGHVPAGLPHQDARIDEVQHLLPERSRRRWSATPWSTAPPAGTRSTSGGWTASAGSA